MTGDELTLAKIVGAAVIIPTVSLFVVWCVRRIGNWVAKSITITFAETVRDVMAPDMARLGTRLGQSVDEMKDTNTRDHARVRDRLGEVEAELARIKLGLKLVDADLAMVKASLGLRPPSARTRATDHPPERKG